jgi:hypothetical protein
MHLGLGAVHVMGVGEDVSFDRRDVFCSVPDAR